MIRLGRGGPVGRELGLVGVEGDLLLGRQVELGSELGRAIGRGGPVGVGAGTLAGGRGLELLDELGDLLRRQHGAGLDELRETVVGLVGGRGGLNGQGRFQRLDVDGLGRQEGPHLGVGTLGPGAGFRRGGLVLLGDRLDLRLLLVGQRERGELSELAALVAAAQLAALAAGALARGELGERVGAAGRQGREQGALAAAGQGGDGQRERQSLQRHQGLHGGSSLWRVAAAWRGRCRMMDPGSGGASVPVVRSTVAHL
ncbi:hypothetical protein D3C72_667660 [compost metagenome]